MIIDLNRSIDNRYEKHIYRLKKEKFETKNIEETIEKTIDSLNKNKSAIIYGKPQSGKTEMMISLTARLLDEEHKIIIILLNDSVSLLNQNLERFSNSGLSPAPKDFMEILDQEVEIGNGQWVLFLRKNANDLRKLKDKLKNKKSFVIIDDEADYVTSNAKTNHEEKVKINRLIEEFISKNGIYIGVTATPARLDLSNAFDNDKNKWICFEPHSFYKGHEVFFPKNVEPLIKGKGDFHLTILKNGRESQSLKEALFSFLINVAYLNLNNYEEGKYSFLIHTNCKKRDQEKYAKAMNNIFNILASMSSSERKKGYYKQIHDLSVDRFSERKAKKITEYICENINRYRVIIMNSDQEKNFRNNQMATKPVTPFTIIIGGNIVSSGVTFDNLLSMFFTEGVKDKMQQDTYIQSAKMFGNRSIYLQHFDLTIPEKLYIDWHQCFLFHKLALASIKSNQGAPLWIENTKSYPSIAKQYEQSHLEFSQREMGFNRFEYNPEIEDIIKSKNDSFSKLRKIQMLVGKEALPQYLIDFVQNHSSTPEQVVIHPSASIENWGDADKNTVYRSKGFISTKDTKKHPHVKHHIRIYFHQKARVFYKNVVPERIKYLSVRMKFLSVG